MDTWETQLWMTSRSCAVSAPHQATVILRWTLVATVTHEREMTLIGRGVQAQHWRPTQDPQWTTQQDQTEVRVYKPCVYQLNHQLSFTIFQRTRNQEYQGVHWIVCDINIKLYRVLLICLFDLQDSTCTLSQLDETVAREPGSTASTSLQATALVLPSGTTWMDPVSCFWVFFKTAVSQFSIVHRCKKIDLFGLRKN